MLTSYTSTYVIYLMLHYVSIPSTINITFLVLLIRRIPMKSTTLQCTHLRYRTLFFNVFQFRSSIVITVVMAVVIHGNNS